MAKWLIEAKDTLLPCPFSGVLTCDEGMREGYRNKVEFSIGHKFGDPKLTVGFQKGEMKRGIFFVDSPEGMPNTSSQALKCASIAEEIVNSFEGIDAYDTRTHTGVWRLFLYKESKRTKQILISLCISKDSLTESQLTEVKESL